MAILRIAGRDRGEYSYEGDIVQNGFFTVTVVEALATKETARAGAVA